MASLVLGIDVGSTSTKVVLAEPSSEVLAQASAPVELLAPRTPAGRRPIRRNGGATSAR